MTEFNNHGGPVHDVEFHPHEFLLASGEKSWSVFVLKKICFICHALAYFNILLFTFIG